MIAAVLGLAGFLYFKTKQESSPEDEAAAAPEKAEALEPEPEPITALGDALTVPGTGHKAKAAAPQPQVSDADKAVLALFEILTSGNGAVSARLKQKVDKPTIEKIIGIIQKQQPGAQRVNFLLPGDKEDAPWATAELGDNLRITFHGFSDEVVASAMKKAKGLGSQLIGSWKGDGANAPIVLLYRQSNQLVLESIYPDQSATREIVRVKYKGPLRTYTPTKPKVPGLYYTLTTNGALHMHDAAGPVMGFAKSEFK